ncbi:hypothetical protein NEOLI_002307 [Neolecta irregularis DAH-3]|uniref:Uncharacterized protein n=1 Tax=Neolecta irregularis (strain DAH-3) TaxID=1198029 RepID=A0A1U7LQC8_NEOID|nr:hypothetical protein NEOLI_002307 [Neolecta irregularis DAH-3]|eukprot:OLL24752.1 hypothetical protein NEOLI_002307 [Neolecta irregularis DAH-3]
MTSEQPGDHTTPTDKLMTKSTLANVSTIPLLSPPRKRTNTQLGTDDRVVLDIGSRFLKAGFTGEPSPRCVLEFTTKDMKRHNVKTQCEEACRLEGVVYLLGFAE